MKKIGAVIISILLFGFTENALAKIDCGEDLNCLINAAKTCTPASYSKTTQYKNFFGSTNDVHTSSTDEIQGWDGEKCVFFWAIQSTTLDHNNQIQNSTDDQETCKYPVDDLVTKLERWSTNPRSFSTMDEWEAECSGTTKVGGQVQPVKTSGCQDNKHLLLDDYPELETVEVSVDKCTYHVGQVVTIKVRNGYPIPVEFKCEPVRCISEIGVKSSECTQKKCQESARNIQAGQAIEFTDIVGRLANEKFQEVQFNYYLDLSSEAAQNLKNQGHPDFKSGEQETDPTYATFRIRD